MNENKPCHQQARQLQKSPPNHHFDITWIIFSGFLEQHFQQEVFEYNINREE
jgi:hypothetical protein